MGKLQNKMDLRVSQLLELLRLKSSLEMRTVKFSLTVHISDPKYQWIKLLKVMHGERVGTDMQQEVILMIIPTSANSLLENTRK